MKIIQSPLLQRQKKKLHKNQIKVLDNVIRKIIDDPYTGKEKRGALKGVRIHKFHISKQLFLLAYEIDDEILNLIMIGSHENYYRELQKYL
ncbi:MAG TPA: addiction module toxin RelE [Actinobacteria bacterium]|nr:addiction module toxin RelE [Actinomycetota bacterium]